MKILILIERFLVPCNHGGRIRSYNTFSRLAKLHEITILSYYDDTIDQPYVNAMRTICMRLELVPWREVRRFSPCFFYYLFLAFFLPVPFTVFKCASRAYQKAMHNLLDEEDYDLIICDFPWMGANLDMIADVPILLFEHNVEFHVWRLHAQRTSSLLRRLYFTREWKKMYKFEKRLWRRCAGIVAVSDQDGQRIRDEGITNVTVVPTGVDTEYYREIADGEENGAIMFLGSMDAIVNEDAVSWFVQDILPAVRARVPDAHFYIVGRDPTPGVQRLHAPTQGVIVTNTVNDVRPYLSRAQVFVVPMRVGGGTRIKIYEGMAAGKAVVSTSLGAEGLHLTSGRNVLFADTNCLFTNAVVNVLTDHNLRHVLAKEARNFVCEQFPWSKVSHIFEKACMQATKSCIDKRKGYATNNLCRQNITSCTK